MRTPPYTIAFYLDLDLCDIRWTGLFTIDAAARYAADVTSRFARSGLRPGYKLRIDMSDCLVQPKDAAAMINQRMRDFPKASRIAIVTGSAIQRLQVRRFMEQPYLRIFDDMAESYRWLLMGDQAVA